MPDNAKHPIQYKFGMKDISRKIIQHVQWKFLQNAHAFMILKNVLVFILPPFRQGRHALSINNQKHFLHSCVFSFPGKLSFSTRRICLFNSSPPSATYMSQWIWSALVLIMVCRLFGVKPLSEPVLGYCQLNSWEQISVKFEWEFYHFHSRKCFWNCCLPKWQPFCPGGR